MESIHSGNRFIKKGDIMIKPSQRLFNITQEMCSANQMGCRPINAWPNLNDQFDVEALNEQASLLPDCDVGLFTDGDESEVNKLTSDLKLGQLNDFLNAVFDGSLSQKITV